MNQRTTIALITLGLLSGPALWGAGDRAAMAGEALAVAPARQPKTITVPATTERVAGGIGEAGAGVLPGGSNSDQAAGSGGCATPDFAAAANFGTDESPAAVAVGDFNSDGRPDLAAANRDSGNVSVLLCDGGGFSRDGNFGAGSQTSSVAVGDFNSDGKLDLAVANLSSNSVSVLLGDGGGGFSAAANFSVGDIPQAVAVGDFDRDGKPDLAAANLNSANVSVLLNTCAANRPPTISPVAVTRRQDSSAASLIAAVADADHAPASLSVTATPVSGSGVTLSPIAVSAAGAVTAEVAASCTATDSTFTLTGSDPLTVECGTAFIDPGASATDSCTGSVSVKVSRTLP